MEMRYNIVIEQDKDGIFIATAPALPGVVDHGDTPDQAFANMGEAMRFTLESMVEEGEELPNPDTGEAMRFTLESMVEEGEEREELSNPDVPAFKEIRPIELAI